MNIKEWEVFASHIFFTIQKRRGNMFVLEGKMSFINIDQNYLKQLHDICSEVYYKESGYDNKPLKKQENFMINKLKQEK